MGGIQKTVKYARRLLRDEGGWIGALIGGVAAVGSALISAFGGSKKKGSKELGLQLILQQQAAEQAAAEKKAQEEENQARLTALNIPQQGGSMGAPYVTVAAPQEQTKTLLPVALAGLGFFFLKRRK